MGLFWLRLGERMLDPSGGTMISTWQALALLLIVCFGVGLLIWMARKSEQEIQAEEVKS